MMTIPGLRRRGFRNTISSTSAPVVVAGVLFLVAIIFFAGPSVAALVVLIVIAMVVAWSRPLTCLLCALILAQEIQTSNSFGPVTVLGNLLYYGSTGSIPYVFYVVIFLWIASIVRDVIGGGAAKSEYVGSGTWASSSMWFVGISMAAVTVISMMSGASFLSTLRFSSLPFITTLISFDIARRNWTRESRSASIVGVASLGLLAVLGAVQTAASGGFVFYDTATAAIAGLALMVALVMKGRLSLILLLAGTSGAVLVLSARRSVIIGLIVSLLILLLFGRARFARRRIWALVIVAMLAAATVASSFLLRISEGLDTLGGEASDVSTLGHTNDIVLGLEYAIARPLGWGPFSPQLPGLAASASSVLYVHNEPLQLWLRYGLPTMIIVMIGLILATVPAFYRINAPGALEDSHQGITAGVATGYPLLIVATMTAPFFSTTLRWPILFGFAIALIHLRERDRRASVSLRSTRPGIAMMSPVGSAQ